MTTGQNITQDTCISLLATRLKISLIIVYLLWIRKALYLSLLVKYSVLYFYYGLKIPMEHALWYVFFLVCFIICFFCRGGYCRFSQARTLGKIPTECGQNAKRFAGIHPMPHTKKSNARLHCSFWWWAGVDSDHRSQ